jgi:dipeptidyl aminopeptidase/acylaminoacyl peptidase
LLKHPRISPKGDLIAFLEHPQPGDDGGSVHMVDLNGKDTQLNSPFLTIQGLTWGRNGDEVWFTGSRTGIARTIMAVTLNKKERVIATVPATLAIQDIWKDGRVLLARESWRRELSGTVPGDNKEQDFSWLDYTFPAELSPDGKVLLFDEEGEGGSLNYSVYLRKTAEASAVRLGDGNSMSLSPDGKWVLSLTASAPAQIVLLPTGAGSPGSLRMTISLTASRAGCPRAKVFCSPVQNKVTGHASTFETQSMASHERFRGRVSTLKSSCPRPTAMKSRWLEVMKRLISIPSVVEVHVRCQVSRWESSQRNGRRMVNLFICTVPVIFQRKSRDLIWRLASEWCGKTLFPPTRRV